MLLLACALLGVRDLHTIWCVVGLMAITQFFGYATELYSSLLIDENAPPTELCGYTLTRAWKQGTLLMRLQMHLLGYAPYVLAWGVVFDHFGINMALVSEAVPDFVQSATFSSVAVFTMFGLVQLVQQLLAYGPSLYWLGEATYVTLSFAAKANLGFVVLFQALVPGAAYDQTLGVIRSGSLAG